MLQAIRRGGTNSNLQPYLSACRGYCTSPHPSVERKKRGRTAKGTWNDASRQREFLDGIANELGIKQMSDWYKISRKEIQKRGGGMLFFYYGSMEEVLRSIYPEFEWRSTEFISAPGVRLRNGFWSDKKSLLEAIGWAETKIGITKPEDWYSITLADLREIGFSGKITKPQLAELLSERYPDYKWDRVYLLKGRYAQQRRLEYTIASLFKGEEVKSNVRKDAELVNPLTGDYLELDVYIPSLKLAFEYQEQHHYTSADFNYKPLDEIQKRDAMKKEITKSKGITLVTVPCWWDGKRESLIATIQKERPDLVQLGPFKPEDAIADSPPPNFFDKEIPRIEGIGQPTTACFFTLSMANPQGWWMFEKFDGIRGFWNPEKKLFYSRKGKTLPIPQRIIDAMPTNIFLDGELWFGRDNFEEAMKISNRVEERSICWDDFKYMVFDIPNHKGTFEERYTTLVEHFKDGKGQTCKYIEVALKEDCKDTTHLEEFYQQVINKGGEGVILRNPSAPLQPGRDPGYLKHKKYRDGEARIIRSVGSHRWECELPNGVRFTAAPGTTAFLKNWLPMEGDIATFKHHGYLTTSKKPKFPTLHRLRPELSWQDVIDNWKEKTYKTASAMPFRKTNKKSKPKGYWANSENRRSYFLDFAKEMNFDPLNPENWKNITATEILAKKGVGPLAKSGSLHAALKEAFPEMQFNLKEHKPSGFWKDINNCRKYFDSIAKEKGFDPLNVENWYLHAFPRDHTLNSYPGGIKAALQRAYPELTFSAWQGILEQKGRWADVKNCRVLFDWYAKTLGLTPDDPNTWHSITASQLLALKGGRAIKTQYGGFRNALQAAYPEFDLSEWPKKNKLSSARM